MFGTNANGDRRRIPGWVGPAVAYSLSIGCLIWVYWDFDWSNELPRILAINGWWMSVAVLADILVYICQAWRWNALLTPVTRVPLWQSVQAIYIGLFANEVLPLRSGEAVRVYLQAHWSKQPFTVILSSALIERMFDGIILILGFLTVGLFIDLPRDLEVGVAILAGVVTALSVLFVSALVTQKKAHDFLARRKYLKILRHLIDGLHTMGRSRTFYVAALGSAAYLLLQVVPLYALARGYDAHLSFPASAALLVILRLGTVIPGPPGNLGVFNVFAMLGLTLLGVDPQTAKGLSGVMFFVITVPLLIAGCIAVASTGLNLKDIHLHAHHHLRTARQPAPEPEASN